MENIMLDLETMGKGPHAAIVAIGAVEFDVKSRAIGERFYAVVDLESSVKAGGVIDASTVMWWLQQGAEARAELSSRSSIPIEAALVQFAIWLDARVYAPSDLCVWGNGVGFDNMILASAYARSGMTHPWPFWGDRCYRTIKAQYPGIPLVRTGTHHNAVDNAESQARYLIAMLNMEF